MDGDVILLGGTRQGERVVLPQRDGRAAKEDVLASPGFCVLLLYLDLADVAGVLDDLCDVGPVTATDFTGDALGEVAEAAVHPVLPENADGRGTDADAKGGDVGLDHAKGAVDGPEEEEDDEHVVGVPEALVVGTSRLLNRGDNHAHESNQHNISCPSRPRHKVGKQPTVNAEIMLDRHLSKVVPMGNSVNPGPENNRPGSNDMKADVLVELDDSVEGRLSKHGNEGSADGEQNNGDVDMENEGGGTGNYKSEAKVVARGLKTLLHGVVDACEGEDEGVKKHKDENEAVVCHVS